MRRLTITADDFGLCHEMDQAICLLHDQGIVQRTSLIVNTELFDQSVAALRMRPGLEVAIHLNVTDGPSVLSPREVPTLVDRSGRFRGGRHYGVAARICAGLLRRNEIHSEWAAQITRAKEAGIEVAQLNSHGHVHLLPPLRGVVVDLLEQFAIPRVRTLSGGSLRGMVLGVCSRRLMRAVRRRGLPVSSGDRVLGLRWQGALNETRLVRALEDGRGDPAELIVHPAVGRNLYHRRWGYNGETEMKALLSAPVVRLLRNLPPGANARI